MFWVEKCAIMEPYVIDNIDIIDWHKLKHGKNPNNIKLKPGLWKINSGSDFYSLSDGETFTDWECWSDNFEDELINFYDENNLVMGSK